MVVHRRLRELRDVVTSEPLLEEQHLERTQVHGPGVWPLLEALHPLRRPRVVYAWLPELHRHLKERPHLQLRLF